MIKSIAIVGGGAGGMCAALGARSVAMMAGQPIEIHLFERNPRLGIKILISGGGKCNITHAGPIEEVINEGFPRVAEQRFLRHALHRFTNGDILQLLDRHGVQWHSRDNGRVFPDSGRAEDVLCAFENELRSNNIVIHRKSRVESIERLPDGWRITTNGDEHVGAALILATGGTSYSKTGTTGDGISYAAKLGHSIVPLQSALAPIYLKHPPVQDLIGIALKEVEVLGVKDGKVLARRTGDVLLTHRGLSGPAILGISQEVTNLQNASAVRIQISLIAMTDEAVRETLISEQRSRPQQQVKTWLEELLPNRLAPFVLDQAEIVGDRKWNALTRMERSNLSRVLKQFDFGEVSEVPLERGEVTAGGVSLKEVDSKTMMSRLIPGLFFAGEMLDIAGEIGGYNLQAAYSTGWVAGEEAVKYLIEKP